MRSKSAEPMAQPWPARSIISTGPFDHKQTAVDLTGLGDQLRQVLDASVDGEVPGLVDDGLDAKRPPFLQVLLDPAVLVAEVKVYLGARREDPPDDEILRRLDDLAGEDHRDLLGPAD